MVGRLALRWSRLRLRGLVGWSLGLRLRDRRMSSELLQTVLLAAGRASDHGTFLAKFHRLVGRLQSIVILSLLVERERQAQHIGCIRLAGIGIDRLLKVFLSSRETAPVVLDRAHRRIS